MKCIYSPFSTTSFLEVLTIAANLLLIPFPPFSLFIPQDCVIWRTFLLDEFGFLDSKSPAEYNSTAIELNNLENLLYT